VDDFPFDEAAIGAAAFFEMSLDLLCVAGFDGYFKRVNPSWTRTLGWSVEELFARPSIEFVHPDDREATLAARGRLRNGLSMGTLTNRYLCKSGEIRFLEWRSVAHMGRQLVYAAARDVTDQRHAEALLEQAKATQEKLQRQLVFADRMASVGTLAAGVAHEINNPLAYVTANVSMMIEELDRVGVEGPSTGSTELREMALEAQAGAERIRKIVRGLKTFSRAEEERRAVIDVRPVLELSINMTFNEIRHRARLVKDYRPTPLVEADEARLGQVFINLLVNAAQALPVGESESHEIRIVTWTDETGRAAIEIRDTGAGIPAEHLGRIFDPFFTTKPVGIGTGIGLSICHSIVTGMSGEIAVTSEPGRGTTFRLVLPPATARVGDSAEAQTSAKPPVVCASILVVDDEPAVGLVLRRVLRDHEVTSLTSASDALALLETGKRFDLILSDLMMPEMSGMDFYDELARRQPALASRIVFISGGAFTPNANAFLDRVPNERLDKPFDLRRVRELVQRMVG
jgi:two-component system cell cycle sensor histidine kinase/response regulator CckA